MSTRDAYKVPCPTCGAVEGERCIAANSSGAYVSQPHRARIRSYVGQAHHIGVKKGK
jgi:hypothetical protein